MYGAISQLVHALLSPEKGKYRGVVLVEYPRKGLYAIGFVTGLAEGELQEKTGDRVLNVLIPTTPNPTSGWYVLVPEREAMSLDMSVEEAFKVIISGGMVVPDRQAPGELQGRIGFGDAASLKGLSINCPLTHRRRSGETESSRLIARRATTTRSSRRSRRE